MNLPKPPRLINKVAVGVVFVDAPIGSDYDLTPAQRTNALAEAMDGLDWLAQQEPQARIKWTWDVKVKAVNVTPFAGAAWGGLPDSWYKGIDAALMKHDNNKIYFFKGDQYARINGNNSKMDTGYPRPIAGNWKGLPASFNNGIDAALWRESNKKIYLFKGSQYVRVDPANYTMDPGYPNPIAGNWKGMPTSFNNGIDAALWRESNGKIYFFKGDQYLRFSSVAAGVDPGYPTKIKGNWGGLSDAFNEKVDAALSRKSNGKVYLFSGANYARMSASSAAENGYPRPIGLTGGQMERLWRDPALAALGHPGDGGLDSYVEALKNTHKTDTAFTVFFTRWPVGHFAYAGFPRVVMHYDNDGWGPANIDRVFAHETGHVFGAPDEYASSGCKCDQVAGRFFRQANKNCANCSGTTVTCIMKSNTQSVCAHTPFHLGWVAFMEGIDAGLYRPSNKKVYLFSGPYYIRIDSQTVKIDPGYPRKIAGAWKGLPSSFTTGIDAAVMRGNGKIYFFKGNQYARINNANSTMDPGYPTSISPNWGGLPNSFKSGIDAAVRRDNGKIYFFKGNQYVRVDDGTAQTDPGYPTAISPNWGGLPHSFKNGIDAAVRRHNDKIYFFRNRTYVRMDDGTAKMDAGYPTWIDKNWMPFPR
jgi:hypothetical protein